MGFRQNFWGYDREIFKSFWGKFWGRVVANFVANFIHGNRCEV